MNIIISASDDKVVNICKSYWELDEGKFVYTVNTIAKKFSISSIEVSKLIKNYCIASSTHILCSSCSEPYKYKSRSEYASKVHEPWTCNSCIIADKQKLEESKKNLLLNALNWRRENFALTIEVLNVREAIILLSLIRYGVSEDLTHIKEYLADNTDYFSPDPDEDSNLIVALFEEKYIAIHPSSNSSAIIAEGDSFSFYPRSVKWLLLLPEEQEVKEFIEQLELKLTSIEHWDYCYDEILEFCEEISLLECLAYLKYTMQEHKLPFSPGPKNKLVLARALEEYSVSQVYNFIWRGVKDSAAFYMRAETNKKHAANTVVGNIEKNFERALSLGWEVKAFGRDRSMPQSVISRILFNVLLRTDDGGFRLPLNKIIQVPF